MSINRVLKFVTHSKKVLNIAQKHGWYPGARYTNLRDVRHCKKLGFLDILWNNYNFIKHFEAARLTRPIATVARDIVDIDDIDQILDQANQLSRYSKYVIVVPKDPRLIGRIDELIPREFILGFSVPTKYGKTTIPYDCFKRPTHLLGGHPFIQRELANFMPVVSLDCNRFTLDAGYGDYFDGTTFRPHPIGGYARCITESVVNINRLWESYSIGDAISDIEIQK
jgi:hypothetical protein